MRSKLSSKQAEEKRHKRNQYILGIALVVVMFGSVFGVIVSSFNNKDKEEKIIHSGYEFQQVNGGYLLTLGNAQLLFQEDPRTLENLSVDTNMSKTIPTLSGVPLYLHSEDYNAAREIYQNVNPYVQRIQPACLDNITCQDENYPIKGCENNFILIKESDENKIYENESCIFIEGKKEDLVKITDEFIFHLFGLK